METSHFRFFSSSYNPVSNLLFQPIDDISINCLFLQNALECVWALHKLIKHTFFPLFFFACPIVYFLPPFRFVPLSDRRNCFTKSLGRTSLQRPPKSSFSLLPMKEVNYSSFSGMKNATLATLHRNRKVCAELHTLITLLITLII